MCNLLGNPAFSTEIAELNLARNKLTSLTPEMFVNVSILSLDLSGNPLRTIEPRSLSALPRLEQLFMSNVHRLNKASKVHFPADLADLKALKTVDMSDNKFWCSCQLVQRLDARFNMNCRHQGGWRSQISIQDFQANQCYGEAGSGDEMYNNELSTFTTSTTLQVTQTEATKKSTEQVTESTQLDFVSETVPQTSLSFDVAIKVYYTRVI